MSTMLAKFYYRAKTAAEAVLKHWPRPTIMAVILVVAIAAFCVAFVLYQPPKSATTPKPPAATRAATLQPLAAEAANAIAVLPVNPNKFGMSLGDTLPGLSQTALQAELADIASFGAGWIRVDLSWSDIQPVDAAHYDWSGFDRVVTAATAAHLKVLAILLDTPGWAQASGCGDVHACPPANPAQFAAFAHAAAAHFYPANLRDWEIWNEPNLAGVWRPAPNASAYATLLKAAYAGIKSADPMATVLSGSLGSLDGDPHSIDQLTFLRQLYAAGARGSFDAVGYHPYSFPVLPSYTQTWNGWSKMYTLSTSMRSIMNNNGDQAKAIWPTEFGAPTNGPGSLATTTNYNLNASPDHVSEALQASMVNDVYQQVQQAPNLGPLFWYTYKDAGTSTATVENFFGLLRADGSQKPAYQTFKKLVNE
ncbi:MAG TPA: cellulase family glycosylhydrolase [Candidatus Acidoferrum sp.]|nr:cellulase family glycosylhydrolase [Candidatus Acidoferrum sp.]